VLGFFANHGFYEGLMTVRNPLLNITRLHAAMDDAGLDGIVAATAENVFYFTGIASVALRMFPHDGQCYAVITRDSCEEPYFVSSRTEVDQVLDAFLNIRGVVTFGHFFREISDSLELNETETILKTIAVDSPTTPDPLSALLRAVTELRLEKSKIGIDELGISPSIATGFREALPDAKVVPAASLLRMVRRVKTPEEVRRISVATHIAEEAILAAMAIAAEGTTELELARELERAIVSQGGLPGFTLLRFGRNGVAGQVRPGKTPLHRNDTIWFDIGCIHEGYWADIARTFAFGEPSERVKRAYYALSQGEQHASKFASPGITGASLFELTVEATRSAGLPHYRRHHVGHGIGLEVYEQPILAPRNESVIEEGMVLNIETPYYEFGLGALHVEDPFLIGSQGNQRLSTLTHELKIEMASL
jgi:Xaa-Pro aminopeptidase